MCRHLQENLKPRRHREAVCAPKAPVKAYLKGFRSKAYLEESSSACMIDLPDCGAGCLSKMALCNGGDVLAQAIAGHAPVVVQ